MLGATSFAGRRKTIYLYLAGAATVICFLNLVFLTHAVDETTIRIPGLSLLRPARPHLVGEFARDQHPIGQLMKEADRQWEQYNQGRSSNFSQTVARYRATYGRHPPPGFKEWYQFARKNQVYNVDDFQQIHDDLRPFWAIPPDEIRQMAARLQTSDSIAGMRIRDQKVVSKSGGWRAETLAQSVGRLAKYLPDMDVAMNTMDQPRVMATYEDIQSYLKIEESTRSLPGDAQDQFTSDMPHFYDENATVNEEIDPGWFSVAGQPYVNFSRESCPPESPARNEKLNSEDADKLYKSSFGGFVSNFTGSTDLCNVGPVLGDKHGFLFSASSNKITRKLVPVFSECKVSVNNDILFPANMYFLKDERYFYNNKNDYEWENRVDSMLWRGVTSGGVQVADNWHRLHRQRFVKMTNATEMNNQTVSILVKDDKNHYQLLPDYHPSDFAASHFDVGFTEAWGCIPDCSFYEGVWTYKDQKPFSEQFKSKYLVDIDGHSFSGRWRAFHQSRSLGIKATIFREWHDSRLFAWRHFIPMDNRFTDLYALMTYFIGLESPAAANTSLPHGSMAPQHDFEAEVVATQSREWAQHALRDEDLDIYLYLLLLEYGRIIDDNRDHIGYSGDGSELAHFDAQYPFPPTLQPLVGGKL
ncbi:Lipopolysaccharide-modifying protein [Penicillium argentinense]|uniref:Lipopolysaccharide-modifying protein n=1 Tax=Penicillium argentinense TaxID=1131581 RepID=A0A9W9EJ08_9EURO|nr:Lipopolysaccharide-modifying protein [Penicillium argentinense]KAJ5082672.1 Lipopolysaccharide-modifying protein [Penicillium argentinense]